MIVTVDLPQQLEADRKRWEALMSGQVPFCERCLATGIELMTVTDCGGADEIGTYCSWRCIAEASIEVEVSIWGDTVPFENWSVAFQDRFPSGE